MRQTIMQGDLIYWILGCAAVSEVAGVIPSLFAIKERVTDLLKSYQLSQEMYSVSWAVEAAAALDADRGAAAEELAAKQVPVDPMTSIFDLTDDATGAEGSAPGSRSSSSVATTQHPTTSAVSIPISTAAPKK